MFLLAASAPAAADVAIDAENFPDAAFRGHVTGKWDANSDGTLSDAEIAAVVSADVRNKGIRSLKGIEHFTKLVSLDCAVNGLMSLDVSKNEKLVKLSCYKNQLTSLDVSKNKELRQLNCEGNQLTELDVSKNTALVKLACSDNQLTALDVSQNEKLETLYCYNNHLTSLDVSKNTKLKELKCERNRLTFLDLGGLDELVPTSVDVNRQARDGLKVRKIGSEYVVDLGMFLLSADRFVKVKDLAGKAGGTDLVARYDFVSGKARFDALPDTVTYRYVTGKDPLSMDVRLTTEPVSPDVPPTPPSGPGVPGTPPSGPGVPPVTSPVSPEPSSGGGGCTAGLGSAALLALVPLAVRRRR